MIMDRLKDPTLLETRGYVDGRWIESPHHFAVVDPATGEQVASVADMTVADTVSAIDAAYAAGPGWAARTGKERAGVAFWSKTPMTSRRF
jgi:succinate-semialdehyde dehydrogenase / glutarate-semialdehyde dehydrogenase